MHYSIVARDFATNRELFLPKKPVLQTVDDSKPLHCAILHGWHSLYAPLKGLENVLRSLPSGHNVQFWQVTYDTHWRTFGQSARIISAELRKRGAVPQNTLLIGYSMGGLVSRSMVANGFDAVGVLCLCTPHLGAAPWMPVGDLGSVSIAPWSARLARLNSNPRDKARRGDYFFQAMTFSDAAGMHHHDRIVTQRSALGEGLEGVGTRHSHKLTYRGIAPGFDPHLHGMYPQHIPEALQWCEEKFAAMALKVAR